MPLLGLKILHATILELQNHFPFQGRHDLALCKSEPKINNPPQLKMTKVP